MKTTKKQWYIPLGALLILMAGGCDRDNAGGSGPDKAPWLVKAGSESGEAIHLFDQLGAATITGTAKELAGGADLAERRVLLSADFEDGGLGGLSVYSGVSPTDGAASRVSVVGGDKAFGGGKSIQLKGGGAAHGLSLRTGPIPVTPTRTYRLSYAVAGDGVRTGRKVRYGGASIIMYRLPGLSDAEAAEALADDDREARARLNKGKNPPAFWIPSRYGTTPWSEDSASFYLPPEATHMAVSFDLNRPEDDREAHKASGTIYFDNILLEEVREPLHVRYQDVDDGFGQAHPLKIRLQTPHSAHNKATEARYGVYAPAPSTLSFEVTVPQGGRMDLGYALLPEAADAKRGEVGFAAQVITADGKSHEVFSADLDHDETIAWHDGQADLSQFAGQKVKVELVTKAPPPDEGLSPLFALPGAAAVWGYPVIHGGTGRTVVLLAFDTLPAKRTSTFGYETPTTPNLSRIAKGGLAFDRAASPSPWTLAGFGAMLTGLDAAHHRAGERQYGTQSWRRPMADGFVTLAEQLRAHGWETRAWINNPYLTEEFGLDQGFSHFIDIATRSKTEASEPALESVLAYLKEPVGYDRFLFVHLMDPHGPYRPNDSWRDRFVKDDGYTGKFEERIGGYEYLDLTQQKLKASDADKARITQFYHAVIAYADDILGQIYDASQKVSGPDRFAFLVTADHGEELWEHGLYEHGHQMYDELLRVPLVVQIPGQTRAGSRVKGAVSAHDVAPTILTFAGIDVPSSIDAKPLQPWFKGDEPPADRPLYGHQMLYGTQRISVERDGWKLLYNQANTDSPEGRSPRPKERYELYNLKDDPLEAKNLYQAEQKVSQALLPLLADGYVRALGGNYVVYVNGPEAHKIQGALTLIEDASWLRYTKDLLWPLKGGLRGKVKFGSPRHPQGRSVLSFDMHAPRGLLGFTVDKGVSPVSFDLKIDGKPVPLEAIRIGRKGLTPEAMPFVPTDDDLAMAPSDLLAAADGAAFTVVVAKLDETPELVGTRAEAISKDLEEQLKELGYTD